MKLRLDLRRNADDLVKLLEQLSNSAPGIYNVTIEVEDEKVVKAKKHYFSLITELAKHAGYLSRPERELFKEQVKKQLGHESIADMSDAADVYIKCEEVHQLAREQYEYLFKPFIPEL